MAKPLKAWRQGKLDIAAWKNDAGAISFTFRKTFKDKNTGEYKETKYLWPSDLEDISKLFSEVNGWWKAREQHNTEHRASGGVDDTQLTKEIEVDDIPF